MKKRYILASAIGGALLGAASTLLVAPKKGKEVRVELNNKFNELKEKLNKEDIESVSVVSSEGSEFQNEAETLSESETNETK